ncbi:MAG: ABC transporter permease [Chloroflexota bacterium]|nr:ABC transporter permease [Chloroflexota bacterium]
MNARLLIQTLRWNRGRLLAVGLAAFGWGVLIPIVYVGFSEAFRELAESGVIPEELLSFGSGNFFTVPGALTLGLEHPLAIAFVAIFAVGASVSAVAGEREGGTLEVLLARPISRRELYTTLMVATVILVALVVIAMLLGQVVGLLMQGIAGDVSLGLMPLVFLNGLLLWSAFAAFGMAASVSFDRLSPALGVTMAFLLINYFLEILGSLWRDVAWSQAYSLFHHFNPGKILVGDGDPLDFLLLAVAIVIPVVYALVVFPRRDLAAPS